MTNLARYRALATFRVGIMAVLVGISLYMYNDWRTHRTQAAPQTLAPMQQPLRAPLNEISGTVEVGPDGQIKKTTN